MSVVRNVMLVYLLNLSLVTGYESYCDVNQTLIVPRGYAAVLNVTNLKTDLPYLRISLVKVDQSARFVIGISWNTFSNLSYDDVHFFHKQIQNRTEITVQNSTKGFAKLEIKINDLQLHDNGTYYADVDGNSSTLFCWVLLVLDLQQIPSGHLSEAQVVRILGQPAASLVKRPVINTTMVWFLDGDLLNETEYFVIQDGAIWTAKIPKELNGKNVTYRAIQDDGTMCEVNLTLHVTYKTSKEMTAIAVLATMQALTTFFLGIFAVIVYRHFKSLSWNRSSKKCCQHTEDRPVEMSTERNIPSGNRQNVQNVAHIAGYVDLNVATRQNTTESENYSAIKTEDETRMYENNTMSQT